MSQTYRQGQLAGGGLLNKRRHSAVGWKHTTVPHTPRTPSSSTPTTSPLLAPSDAHARCTTATRARSLVLCFVLLARRV